MLWLVTGISLLGIAGVFGSGGNCIIAMLVILLKQSHQVGFPALLSEDKFCETRYARESDLVEQANQVLIKWSSASASENQLKSLE